MEIENVFDFEEELDCIDEDDEIYEKIEAPKFVDFTRDDHFLPDDRSWFCARIGCDQTHEDVDPDALHKSFVLRVMAARSPNLRLRKALRSREVPSAYMKCPMSAPAKPSKPRVCRFTAMASITHKRANVKAKVHPVSKVTLTPNTKPMESSASAKALTTPRVRNCIPSSDHFRSVQNQKTTAAVQKSKVVAKELVFGTPKKSERNKVLSESETPLTEICVGMKKLELNSQRKITSLNSSKSLRRGASRAKPSTTGSDPSTSKLYNQKVKSRVKDSEDLKLVQGVSSSIYAKGSRTKKLKKVSFPQPSRVTNNDMETDGESKNGSLGFCSVSGASRSNEADRNKQQTTLGVTGTTQEECVPSLPTSLIAGNVQKALADDGSYPNVRSLSSSENVSEERDESIHVSNAKALIFNTPKESEKDTTLLTSETPLTEICNGMNKLVLNSQKPKPSVKSSKLTICTASRSRNMKSRIKESEVGKNQGVKYMKSRSTNILQKLSSPQLHSVTDDDVKTDRTISNENKELLDFETTPGVAVTIEEECIPTSDTCLIGDGLSEGPGSVVSEERDGSTGITENCLNGEKNVQSVLVDAPSDIQANDIPNSVDLGNKEHDKHQIAQELKISEEKDDGSVLQTSDEAGIENGSLNTDDKENATASDDNRNLHLRNIQNENHENQQKGKSLKGNSTLLGKYKKTKPTNPKPFRLRTDERVILREANLEKRHLPAPLKEITLVSRISDGNTQRRHPNEEISKKKLKSSAQCVQETEVDKQVPKIQRQQIRSVYNKATISSVQKVEHLASTMRTQRGTGTRKTTTISLVASRRLSIIKEKPSAILRTKDTKVRIKSTIPSSSRVKKPLTIPKEPNFHRTRTPKRGTKTVAGTTQPPKKIVPEVIVS